METSEVAIMPMEKLWLAKDLNTLDKNPEAPALLSYNVNDLDEFFRLIAVIGLT